MNTITLNSGFEMPVLGLGTWKAPEGQAGAAVAYALKLGYKHIDCAWIYRNEGEIGRYMKEVFNSGEVKREDIFITSKLWNSYHRPEYVIRGVKETLSNLQLDYLDLYLMHWGIATPPGEAEPLDENGYLISDKVPLSETWHAMENLVKEGLVKSIGVSNFTAPLLIDLSAHSNITPAVNQIELHPYLTQQGLVDLCQYKGIAVTAYSPLGNPGRYGEEVPLNDPKIKEISTQTGKTPSQVLIRWAIQRGTIVIPKSVTPSRIEENFHVFDFELSPDQISVISALNRNHRFTNPYSWWKVPYFNYFN